MTYRLQRTLPITLDGVTSDARVTEFRAERTMNDLVRSAAMAPSVGAPSARVASEQVILTIAVSTRWTSEGFSNPFLYKLDGLIGSTLPYVSVGFSGNDVRATIKRTGMGEPRLGAPEETARIELLMFGVGADDFAVNENEWEFDCSRLPELLVARPKPEGGV